MVSCLSSRVKRVCCPWSSITHAALLPVLDARCPRRHMHLCTQLSYLVDDRLCSCPKCFVQIRFVTACLQPGSVPLCLQTRPPNVRFLLCTQHVDAYNGGESSWRAQHGCAKGQQRSSKGKGKASAGHVSEIVSRLSTATRCAEKRGALLPMDGPSKANTVATASQRRSTFIRVKRLHGLSGPKESDGEPTSGTIVSQPRR